jgi:DNA replication ATP-dependent helicase Dna2
MTSAKQISPSRVGRYFHLECLRFLRYSSTPKQALVAEDVPAAPYETRPVQRAVLDTGYQWEERALAGPLAGIAEVAQPPPDKPKTPPRERVHSLEATAQLLRDLPPGRAIYQASLRAPEAFYARYDLPRDVVDLRDCRPDLIDARTGEDGRRLLRVTDLKVSRGLKLSHRVQAALYSLLLEAIVEEQGIDASVDRSPAIWLVNEPEASPFDIRAILPPLEQFLHRDLRPLLAGPASAAGWHFNSRCEACPYFEHCREEMRSTDNVSRVPGLSSYAKDYLVSLEPPVRTVDDLASLLDDPERRDLLEGVGSLRGHAAHLRRQVEALQTGTITPHGGNSLAMPIAENVRLVFTVQTEPVGGNVYAWAVTAQGLKGLVDPNPFTASDVAASSRPDEIRRVERGLIAAIYKVLLAVHEHNEANSEDWAARKSLQAYAFDTYEEALLTGVLVRGLSDAEVAEQALAVFFHFQRPELMEASDHPSSEASIPVVVLVRVIRDLLALPVEISYLFADVVRLLAREDRAFTYENRGWFDYELSNQLRPDAVFSLWNDGDLERVGQIERALRARVWAASSLVDGLRQRLDKVAPKTLFAWPPKFRLPDRMAFDHPILSRLAFVARYEATLDGLETRQARMGPIDERLRNGRTIELVHAGGDRFRLAQPDLEPQIDGGSFPNWLLTPATEEGQRASLLFNDHAYRDKAYPPRDRQLALAGVEDVERTADDLAIAVRLKLTRSSGFAPPELGQRFHLGKRYTDWNSSKVVGELAAEDRELDPRFVHLLDDPAARAAAKPLPVSVRATALELARRHGMTASQLEAFERLTDHVVTLAWGPPGTGKTHFVALAILCLVEAHRRASLPYSVLVTAFTHAAIDNCLRKVSTIQVERRVVSGDLSVGKVGKAELAGMGRIDAVDKKAAGRYLDQGPHAVLGGTVWGLSASVPVGRADLLVIDEGSQLKVPESVIPVRRLASTGRLLVAGDHLQLPPIVKGAYPEAAEDEPLLHRSIFEALRGPSDESPVMVSLLENFRMNGVLCRYPAAQIYDARYDSADDEIRHRRLRLINGPGDGLAGSIVDPEYPLVIVEIDGFRATSENALEAIVVTDVAARLRERMLDASGALYRSDAAFWSDGLFIVSPHHAHIGAIRRRLAKKRAWTSPPFVGTVDKMQGQECDAVIASYGVADVEYALVEQEFIYSLNRLNVSITRGRAKTIVLLSKALTNPPIQAFAKEENAAGIGFMQGLVQFAEENGSARRFTWKDGAKLRVIRVPATT